MATLRWQIIHCIGKETNDPAGNILRWEHAYIDFFDNLVPKGLNKRE